MTNEIHMLDFFNLTPRKTRQLSGILKTPLGTYLGSSFEGFISFQSTYGKNRQM